MTELRDPYGVLGLTHGASLDDVKRAYRKLAKQHHPDSGGERTLKRFLEIQAAYEQLVHGRPGAGGSAAANSTRRASWQADPARADATRRAYGSRGRRSGTGTQGRERPPAGGAQPAGGAPPKGEPRRRGPRKATLGSTSYDEAAGQPFDPDWTGASWYGTTSGTYWTLNPREYADPRKHGPEYQARARRKAGGGELPADDDVADPELGSAEGEDEPAARADDAPQPDSEAETPPSAAAGWRPAAETSTGTEWSATPGTIERTPGERDTAPTQGVVPGERRRASAPVTAPSPPAPGARDVLRLLDPRTPRSPAGRLGLALAGGVPIAIWLAWLLGELTGCGRFAATCEPGVVTAAWVVGFALVVALIMLPAAAAILVAGAAGAVVAAIPATVFLTATGGARMPQESGIVLGLALIVGWLAGVMLATNYWWRGSGRPGPVS